MDKFINEKTEVKKIDSNFFELRIGCVTCHSWAGEAGRKIMRRIISVDKDGNYIMSKEYNMTDIDYSENGEYAGEELATYRSWADIARDGGDKIIAGVLEVETAFRYNKAAIHSETLWIFTNSTRLAELVEQEERLKKERLQAKIKAATLQAPKVEKLRRQCRDSLNKERDNVKILRIAKIFSLW